MNIQPFDRTTIVDVNWPATPDGDYARRYLTPLMMNSPQTYIANVYTELRGLRVDDVVLPFTLGQYHPENSFVASPYTHYITYGQVELNVLKKPRLEAALGLLFIPIGRYFRHCDFDRVALVNNWLLSTNLYPAISPQQSVAVLRFLVEAFPDRAIVFRCLDTYANAPLCEALTAAGCRMIFSRQIYYQDARSAYVQRKRQFQSDLKWHRRTLYRAVDAAELSPEADTRIRALYNQLYLDKYSRYNPQFTEEFVRLARAEKLLHIKALLLDGRIDAVCGYFVRRGFCTAPLFGYDRATPQTVGLYRLLSMQVVLESQAQNCVLNASAGVGEFKRIRGGLPTIEYNAVYDAHLPARRRRPWGMLKGVMNGVVIPMMEKYGF